MGALKKVSMRAGKSFCFSFSMESANNSVWCALLKCIDIFFLLSFSCFCLQFVSQRCQRHFARHSSHWQLWNCKSRLGTHGVNGRWYWFVFESYEGQPVWRLCHGRKKCKIRDRCHDTQFTNCQVDSFGQKSGSKKYARTYWKSKGHYWWAWSIGRPSSTFNAGECVCSLGWRWPTFCIHKPRHYCTFFDLFSFQSNCCWQVCMDVKSIEIILTFFFFLFFYYIV